MYRPEELLCVGKVVDGKKDVTLSGAESIQGKNKITGIMGKLQKGTVKLQSGRKFIGGKEGKLRKTGKIAGRSN